MCMILNGKSSTQLTTNLLDSVLLVGAYDFRFIGLLLYALEPGCATCV
jgi:hypothetical protein